MTGRKAYELYTSEMGKIPFSARADVGTTQVPPIMSAWDDLDWREQNAWVRIAKRIKGTRATA